MKIPADWNPGNSRFRSFYGWDEQAGRWELSLVPVDDGDFVACHYFTAAQSGKEPKGTLFIIHGYLEHTALRMPLILEALRAGWDVVGMDLLGHGFSTGPVADIDSFNRYGRAFREVLRFREWKKPWRFAGHSTGCATGLLCIREIGNPFEWALLEAPVIRTFLWQPTMVAKRLLRGAINTLPRRHAGMARNKTFYRLLFKDPLYIGEAPVHWFDALEQYEADSRRWGKIGGYFLILQGTADTVLDWNYNIRFLRDRLPESEIVLIKGGHHHLLRDEGPAGQEAREAVRQRW
ncbi:MAG: lysophospholipase [Treponemataceae bacterium]|nr:lysophospholipase [Treponemataceae bacterium]